MTEQELEAIVGGYHGDPFRILGPHPSASATERGGWEVRAFLPQARQAALVNGTGTTEMERIHPYGLFGVRSAKHPGKYKIRYIDYDGGSQEVDDPYRFPPLLSDFDLHLLSEGTNYEAYSSLGAHSMVVDGVPGTRFSVWAPNALVVSVVGNFNAWDERRHPMRARTSGVWELFLPEIGEGVAYKFAVKSRFRGYSQMKTDPYGFAAEEPPKSASIVTDLSKHQWNDDKWIDYRGSTNWLDKPVSIYEVHLGSWVRSERNRPLSYRELAKKLIPYVTRMGYTHIELMPILEYPFTGSWGYQVVGYFAPTSRYGTPEDFMFFVDQCHAAGIGVLVDWVPAHFPKDAHGLAFFDGTALYEHEDPRKGEHRDWGTLIFNFGRNEVKSFLISSAMFWLKKYHIDGLRVDAVASMLYLDYSRKAGEWVPNVHGGNENLEAIDFLKKFNELAHQVPGVITAAEESTAFPGVSKPVYLNGLGFTMKWNMGWMHDTLHYFESDPIYRSYHQNEITFSLIYAFSENFILPISHDEVVYGKKSLIGKMPGDEWQRFANNRAFMTYMYAHPGKKLLFMGAEIGQGGEWNYESQLDWWLLDYEIHRQFQEFNAALNKLYKQEPAMYEVDFQYQGFEWLDIHDWRNSIVSFIRKAKRPDDHLVVICNFTPQPHHNYRIGIPEAGEYQEIFNSDWKAFGGSGVANDYINAVEIPSHNKPASVELTIPPLAVMILKPKRPLQPLSDASSATLLT